MDSGLRVLDGTSVKPLVKTKLLSCSCCGQQGTTPTSIKPNQSSCSLAWSHNLVAFGALKELATDGGYEPSGAITADFDLAEFGITHNGYKAGDQITMKLSSINEEPTQDEINLAINKSKDELPQRQTRMVIEDLYGKTNKIKFNELTQEIEILGEAMKPYEFEDAHHWIDRKFNVLSSANAAQSALRTVANDNRYHPVQQYLELVAKQEEEIDLSLVATRCLGATDQLSIAMVRCWLVGAVSKALNPLGSQFIEVLTLVSPKQGIGKSEFFKSLASPDWFNDSFAQTEGEKDRVLSLHSSWINEISEVDQFALSKQSFKQLKGLISSTQDLIRVPYGRTTEKKQRRFVIGATSNEEELYSSDDEQRRFWSITVNPSTPCGRLDIEWLRDNRDRIWATATRLYQQQGDAAFKLSAEQRSALIQHNQREFTKVSEHHNDLAHWLADHNVSHISSDQLLRHLNLTECKQSKRAEINGIMKSEGYVRKRNLSRGGKSYSSCWVNESRQNDLIGKTIFQMDF